MKTLQIASFCVACLANGCSPALERAAVVAHADGEQVTVRTDANHLWWSRKAWSEPHELWTLPSNGPVENLTVRAAVATRDANTVFEVTFNQGGLPWRGWFAVDPAASIDTRLTSPRESDHLAMDSTFADLARSGR